SGGKVASRPPSPLRTVRETFASYGSSSQELDRHPRRQSGSLSLRGARVQLRVTRRVEQLQVGQFVRTAVDPPHHVMNVPSRGFGDLGGADWADALLSVPQPVQPPASLQSGPHPPSQSLVEVGLVLWVVWVGIGPNLYVPDHRNLGQVHQAGHIRPKEPVAGIVPAEVPPFDPPLALHGMPTRCPSP